MTRMAAAVARAGVPAVIAVASLAAGWPPAATPPPSPGPHHGKRQPVQPAPGPLTPKAVLPRPSPQCHPQVSPAPRVTRQPWAQRVLAFASVWKLTRGSGQTVAVVDSGVDYSPQLSGRVTAISLKDGYPDCFGHGTAIAGIIAASDRRKNGMPFTGVAPDASILSVKVNQGKNGSPLDLAQGIRDAALLGAGVINVSVAGDPAPQLASAVKFALSHGAVIVAAAGNDTPASPGQPALKGPFYPASYPGVISVGAVTQSGAVWSGSDQHSRADVTAPGRSVTSTWPGGYEIQLTGTSFATAFVSGVAALVRARYPHLKVPGVVNRIEATADGNTGPGTGDGLVNPLQAVTAILPPPAGGSARPATTPGPISVATAPAPPRLPTTAALTITGGAVTGAVAVAIGAVVISRGRRRRWRAARAGVPAGDR